MYKKVRAAQTAKYGILPYRKYTYTLTSTLQKFSGTKRFSFSLITHTKMALVQNNSGQKTPIPANIQLFTVKTLPLEKLNCCFSR